MSKSRTQASNPPTTLDKTIYGSPWTKVNGNTYMKAVLGPAAIESTNYGSRPDDNKECTRVKKLNNAARQYPELQPADGPWVAGHLLNDNLGGHGISKNLTPLTTTANRNHASVESKIKKILEYSNSTLGKHKRVRNESGALEDVTYWYGVEYTVEAEGQIVAPKDQKALFSHVSQSIKLTLRPMRQKRSEYKSNAKAEVCKGQSTADQMFLDRFDSSLQGLKNARNVKTLRKGSGSDPRWKFRVENKLQFADANAGSKKKRKPSTKSSNSTRKRQRTDQADAPEPSQHPMTTRQKAANKRRRTDPTDASSEPAKKRARVDEPKDESSPSSSSITPQQPATSQPGSLKRSRNEISGTDDPAGDSPSGSAKRMKTEDASVESTIIEDAPEIGELAEDAAILAL